MRSIIKSERPSTTTELYVVKFDGNKTKTLGKFYRKLSKRLKFPAYFGGNMDALADCLCDLSWIGQPQVKLFIKNIEGLLSEEKIEIRQSILDIFEEASANQIEENKSFEVVSVIEEKA